jgi:hypothetical protein
LVVSEQTTDGGGGTVALRVSVDDQRSAARPAQHQGGTQARRAAADDDTFPFTSGRLPLSRTQTGMAGISSSPKVIGHVLAAGAVRATWGEGTDP